MSQIFNRDAINAVILMAGILVCLLFVLHFTGDTEALATCKAARSSDVCEATINP